MLKEKVGDHTSYVADKNVPHYTNLCGSQVASHGPSNRLLFRRPKSFTFMSNIEVLILSVIRKFLFSDLFPSNLFYTARMIVRIILPERDDEFAKRLSERSVQVMESSNGFSFPVKPLHQAVHMLIETITDR